MSQFPPDQKPLNPKTPLREDISPRRFSVIVGLSFMPLAGLLCPQL